MANNTPKPNQYLLAALDSLRKSAGNAEHRERLLESAKTVHDDELAGAKKRMTDKGKTQEEVQAFVDETSAFADTVVLESLELSEAEKADNAFVTALKQRCIARKCRDKFALRKTPAAEQPVAAEPDAKRVKSSSSSSAAARPTVPSLVKIDSETADMMQLLRARCEKHKEQKAALATKNAELEADAAKLKASIAVLEKKLKTAEGQVKALTNQIVVRGAAQAEQAQKVAQMQKEIAEEREAHEALQQEHAEVLVTQESQVAQVSRLQSQLHQEREQCTQLREALYEALYDAQAAPAQAAADPLLDINVELLGDCTFDLTTPPATGNNNQ